MRLPGIAILASVTVTACSLPAWPPNTPDALQRKLDAAVDTAVDRAIPDATPDTAVESRVLPDAPLPDAAVVFPDGPLGDAAVEVGVAPDVPRPDASADGAVPDLPRMTPDASVDSTPLVDVARDGLVEPPRIEAGSPDAYIPSMDGANPIDVLVTPDVMNATEGLVVVADASPRETGLGAFASVSAGSDHACVLNADGTIVCWATTMLGEAHTRARPRRPKAPSFLSVRVGSTAAA